MVGCKLGNKEEQRERLFILKRLISFIVYGCLENTSIFIAQKKTVALNI